MGLKGSTLSGLEIILPNNATLYIAADGMASKGMVTLPEVIHSTNNIFVAMLDEILSNQIEYTLDSDKRVCLFESITKDNQTLDGVDLDIDGFPTKLVGVIKGYIR